MYHILRNSIVTTLLLILPQWVEASPAGRYVVQTNTAYVLDTQTGLQWLRVFPLGTHTQQEAAANCAARGQGWRLPSVKEMATVVAWNGTTRPAFDTTTFTVPTTNGYFWTSSNYTVSSSLEQVWIIRSEYGDIELKGTVGSYYFTCVK